jgi:hypothetical protein
MNTSLNSINQIDSPTSDNICDHIWRTHGTRRNFNYGYICEKCRILKYVKYVIPPPLCNHQWKLIDHDLGRNYNMELCYKCEQKKVTFIGHITDTNQL